MPSDSNTTNVLEVIDAMNARTDALQAQVSSLSEIVTGIAKTLEAMIPQIDQNNEATVKAVNELSGWVSKFRGTVDARFVYVGKTLTFQADQIRHLEEANPSEI